MRRSSPPRVLTRDPRPHDRYKHFQNSSSSSASSSSRSSSSIALLILILLLLILIPLFLLLLLLILLPWKDKDRNRITPRTCVREHKEANIQSLIRPNYPLAAPTTVAAAAKAHVRSEETVELAAAVASLAWNAERVVQAVMAALASADTDDFDAIELSLTVPPDDRGGSPWYTKPDNPLALAQRKRKRARLVSIDEEIIRRLATYHVDLLRAFVNDLVQNRDEYNLMSLNAAIVGNLDRLKNAATPPTDLKPGDAETDDEYYKRVPLWSDVAAELQRLLDRLLDMVVSEEDGRTVAETLIKNIASQGGADQLRTHIDKTRESLQQASATIKNVEDRLKRLLASADMRGEFVPLRLALRLGRERAPPVGDASAALRPRHALVGALGVGMAMLDPLVGNALALRCGTIRPDASGDAGVVDAFRKAFAARVPLRLSEACVVVCSRV